MNKYQGLWSRWHRYDMNGVKQIKRFEIDEIPCPLIDEGYTEWVRGTGPLSPEHYKNVAEAVRNTCKGKPKSPEQKMKMSKAAAGRPKSEEHKQSMREAWKRRRLQNYVSEV